MKGGIQAMTGPCDPIEALFSGIESGLVRFAVVLIAIILGEAVCYFSRVDSFEMSALIVAVPMLVGMPFLWMTKGALALVGLMALIAMLASAWAFTQEMAQKITFFSTFSASAVFCAPLCFTEDAWLRWVTFYGVLSAIYWLLPRVLRPRKRDS